MAIGKQTLFRVELALCHQQALMSIWKSEARHIRLLLVPKSRNGEIQTFMGQSFPVYICLYFLCSGSRECMAVSLFMPDAWRR